jgi:hypothetical protein
MFVAMERSFVEAFRKDFPAVLALSVAHSPAARERIPVTRPLVIVIASSVTRAELQDIVDVAEAVGAEVIRMSAGPPTPVSYFRIKKALIARLERLEKLRAAGPID